MNVDALIDSIAKKAEPVRDLVDYEKDGLLYCGSPSAGASALSGASVLARRESTRLRKKLVQIARSDCASKRCVLTESATRA